MQSSKSKRVKNKNYFTHLFLLFCVISVVFAFVPMIVFSFYMSENYGSYNYSYPVYNSEQKVEIELSKQVYESDENISFDVINLGSENIYLQPCGEIGIFQKKIDGEWVSLNSEKENEIGYDGFDKKDTNLSCDIESPSYGGGIYRLVVPVFFKCEKANPYACENSKNVYSDSFEILSEDLCESDSIEKCDGKLVSVLGSFSKSENGEYFLEDTSLSIEEVLLDLSSISEQDIRYFENTFCYIEGVYYIESEHEDVYIKVNNIDVAITDI